MNVPVEAGAAQARAARPDRSSWVAANAGSGKTRVLTNRVARLLLRRIDPQKILCLTFTNAAAAEMQNRLFRQLGEWAMLPDAGLRKELSALGAGDEVTSEEGMREARRLFARALETPGGLKIQTIHAFCDRLLRRFPLEAGVSPDFSEIDQTRTTELTAAVLDELAEDGGASGFDAVAQAVSGSDLDGLLKGILSARARFRMPFDAEALRKVMGAPKGRSVADILAGVMATVQEADLHTLAVILKAGSANDQKTFAKLRAALLESQPEARLEGFESVFLLGKNPDPDRSFTAKIGAFPTKALRLANTDLMARIEPMMAAVETARQERLALAAFERSVILNQFARAFLAAYDARKRALGLMDFDDLIERAGALLNNPDVADWVLYRLDGGIDHVLVDEAQDTSPAQWHIIDAVTREFFTGKGARDYPRTIFAVGDFKQSIYSFQGAEPAAFLEKKRDYQGRIADLGASLQDCALLHSFRSAPPILSLVDRIFSGPQRGGVEGDILHYPANRDKPGRVDLWPFFEAQDKAEPEPWYLPVDMPMANDPLHVLARSIAAEIAGWLREGRVLPGKDRAIRAGDVLILVQKRKVLFHAIIRELKVAGVAVAGADKLIIGEELAVKDMLSLLRFLATPGDDLSLAEALRSPIFGISEAELFSLAHGREGTLWRALRNRSEEFSGIVDRISALMRFADFERPFEMIERVLVQQGARGRILARLGAEAKDGLDELLSQALAYEQSEAPTLSGFLERMQSDEIVITRQTDDRSDQVRVMTVHGAKGLESEIVFLPDTLPPQGNQTETVVKMPGGQVAWPTPGAAPAAIQAARDRQAELAAEERMRLLYVALTRAEHWLIVCGAGEAKKRPGSWYDLVADALGALGAEDAGAGCSLEHEWRPGSEATAAEVGGAAEQALPDWATVRAYAPQKPVRPLQPSDLGGEHSLPGETDAENEESALRRGRFVHLLLEGLPALPRNDWPEAARRILRNDGASEESDDLATLSAEAIAVLGTPEFAAIFAPDALAEVPLVAELKGFGGRMISGRIDRLVVGERDVLAVDFKSNRVIPASPEAIPEAVLRQMGACRAALCRIWPDHTIRTAILWTHAPVLMAIPDEIVAAALQRAALP